MEFCKAKNAVGFFSTKPPS